MDEDITEPLVDPEWKPPVAWVTWGIVGSTVAVFLAQLAAVHWWGDDVVGNAMSFSPDAWANHQYWTLLTYAWAHATAMFNSPDLFWLHLAANMIPVFCLGPAVEEFLGHARYLGLYLGGAVVAALTWFIFNPEANDGIIGASGAVFAVIAAAGTIAPRAPVVVYVLFVLPIRMRMGVVALVACGVEAVQALPFLDWMPEVAHSAHLGGAAFGFVYVKAMERFWRG